MLGGMRHMEDGFGHLMTPLEKEHPEVTVLRQVSFGSPRAALLTAAAEQLTCETSRCQHAAARNGGPARTGTRP